MTEPDRTAKPERPRDELGRPLPWGSENRLDMEDYENLSIDENHRLAVEHFNAHRFFPAHEAWEGAWRLAAGTDEEEFFQGLAQLGAGYTHFHRGNPRGAATLLGRALARIGTHGDRHRGLDILALSEHLRADITRFEAAAEAGETSLDVTPPAL